MLFTVEPILFKTYTTSTIITEEFLYSNRARKSFEPRFYWTDFFYAELTPAIGTIIAISCQANAVEAAVRVIANRRSLAVM